MNDSTKFSNTGYSFGAQNMDTVTGDRSQLLTWLSPLSPSLRHWDIQEHRVNEVGEWLFKTEEFRRWYVGSERGEGEKAVLFCYGDPGVGKTFIRYQGFILSGESKPVLMSYDDSSLVADGLCDLASEQNVAVSCFYLDFAAGKEQSATNVLGSLLNQMIAGMERIPEEISRAFQRQKTTLGGRRPELVNIVKMLQLITSSQRIFMCIDAIDECEGVQQVRLLDSLKQILDKSPGTRLFATGRPYILAEIAKRLAGHVKSVSISPAKENVTTYLRARLGEDQTPDAMDESLEAEILEKIPENVSGRYAGAMVLRTLSHYRLIDIFRFRLASLNIEAILRESTIYRRRERLRKMSAGLGLEDVYSTTIERVKAQDGDKSRLGMAALMWIIHAERPLRANELCCALGVELGSKDFNAGNVPSASTLVGCCQGLITVDKKTSAVRLIHLTVKEYLSARPHIISNHISNSPHAVMAEICLTYLISKQVKALSTGPSDVIHDKPFLGYCSLYWGVHAKRDLSDRASLLALELLQEYDGHISGKLLLEQVEYQDRWDSSSSFGRDPSSDVRSVQYCHSSHLSGLECASFFGITEVAAALRRMESDINQAYIRGHAPLAWAARNGHAEVVEMLLGSRRTSLQRSDCSYLTSLSYAAWKGHERVVNILLGRRDVCPGELDNHGRTPLTYAAWGGHERVMRTLLSRTQINPGEPDNHGRTPLSYAASGGYEGVVNILLEQAQVNPLTPDNHGRTPLSYAVWAGHEEVVKTLLGRAEANADNLDIFVRSPLSYAAERGHEQIVKILLTREEVSPHKPDDHGRTPLSYAARNGHERIVKILLGREAVNPTSQITAAKNGSPMSLQGVVKILPEREEVNPNKPNNDCRTLL